MLILFSKMLYFIVFFFLNMYNIMTCNTVTKLIIFKCSLIRILHLQKTVRYFNLDTKQYIINIDASL